MNRVLRVRMERVWISFSQSRLFLPLVAVFFVLLASVVLLMVNLLLVQGVERVKQDDRERLACLMRMWTAEHDFRLSLIADEITWLATHDPDGPPSSRHQRLKDVVPLLDPLGVTQLGRLDDRGSPALTVEAGADSLWRGDPVQSVAGLNTWVASHGTGLPLTRFIVHAPVVNARGLTHYVRLDAYRYVQSLVRGFPEAHTWFLLPTGEVAPVGTPGEGGAHLLDWATLPRPFGTLVNRFPQLHRAASAHPVGNEPASHLELEIDHTSEGPLGILSLPFWPDEKDSPVPALIVRMPASPLITVLSWAQTVINTILVLIFAALLVIGMVFASYQRRLFKRLRQVVGEQDQILSGVLSNVVDGIIVLDDEDRIQMWNRGAQLIFGYSPEEMLGEGLERLIPPDIDVKTELRSMAHEVRQKGYLRNHVTQRMRADGTRITVDISHSPYHGPGGQYQGYTVVVKDVTEKMDLDRKLYSTEKLASIGLLASGVAHEINNPLSVILGFVDLLKERFEEGSDEHKDLSLIESNAQQAKAIVDDLLGFSRAERASEDRLNLPEAIENFVAFIRNTRIMKQVDMTVEVDDPLPAGNGDPRELHQVLLNLVNNAVAACDNRRGKISIHAWQHDEDWLRLEVGDNGRGIPADVRAKVFDPFFTTKAFGEGTGLGLSLCYGLIKKWGGDIDFETVTADESADHSSGTTFTISIPVYDEGFNPEATS